MESLSLTNFIHQHIEMIQTDEQCVFLVGPVQLPVTVYGKVEVFQWYVWLTVSKDEAPKDEEMILEFLQRKDLANMQLSSVLVYGDFDRNENALIRMHSICHTGDVFGSQRCDCGPQLTKAKQMIVQHGCGAIFYLANQEGRGIGLFNKALAYLLQEQGYDTVEANIVLGFDDDLRSYKEAIWVLKHLRKKPVKIITNNPKKIEQLQQAGVKVTGRIGIWCDPSPYNEKYIQTKIERSGHFGDVLYETLNQG